MVNKHNELVTEKNMWKQKITNADQTLHLQNYIQAQVKKAQPKVNQFTKKMKTQFSSFQQEFQKVYKVLNQEPLFNGIFSFFKKIWDGIANFLITIYDKYDFLLFL